MSLIDVRQFSKLCGLICSKPQRRPTSWPCHKTTPSGVRKCRCRTREGKNPKVCIWKLFGYFMKMNRSVCANFTHCDKRPELCVECEKSPVISFVEKWQNSFALGLQKFPLCYSPFFATRGWIRANEQFSSKKKRKNPLGNLFNGEINIKRGLFRIEKVSLKAAKITEAAADYNSLLSSVTGHLPEL